MPSDPRSEEFAARYRELCGATGVLPLTHQKEPATGTFGWIVEEHLSSGAFSARAVGFLSLRFCHRDRRRSGVGLAVSRSNP
jgi:hypothetical protein